MKHTLEVVTPFHDVVFASRRGVPKEIIILYDAAEKPEKEVLESLKFVVRGLERHNNGEISWVKIEEANKKALEEK